MRKDLLSMLLALSMMLTMLAACNNDPVVDETPDDGQQQEEQEENEVVSDTLTLVAEGVSDYVIVRGENAYISEVTASTELQNYLKQITGVVIPIVTDATAPVEKEIVVGKTNREAEGEFNREELGKEGFIIKSTGSKLYLVGGEQRGTLYSVYSFLEEYLGVRYYFANVEKVPQMTTITLEAIAENKQIPVFEARMSDALPKNVSWSVKQKINDNTHLALGEELGGGVAFPGKNHSGEFAHSMQYYVNYNTYKDTHPEYFAVDENGNILNDRPQPQCCLNNPDVLQLVIDGVRKMLAEKPYVNYVDISENDNKDTCRCEKCLQVIEEEGAHSGNVIRFVNAVADAIKDEYPDVKVETLAYFATIDAPMVTKPRDNVMVRMAPIEQCILHGTEECQKWFTSEYTKKSTYQILKEWAALDCELFIWDYDTNFDATTHPYLALYSLKKDVRLYADSNVKGVFFQGNSYSNSGNFEELRSYLLAKLYWNPYMSDEEFEYHINDFLQGFYGEGWEYIRAYIDDLFEIVGDTHLDTWSRSDKMFDTRTQRLEDKPVPEELTVESFMNPETVDWSKYYDYYSIPNQEFTEFMNNSFSNFEASEALAKDEAELNRIRQSKISLLTVEIYYLRKCPIMKNLTELYANCCQGLDASYRTQFVNYVRTLVNNIVIEKNSYLFDEMLKYGVGATPYNANLRNSKESADLTQMPEDWY